MSREIIPARTVDKVNFENLFKQIKFKALTLTADCSAGAAHPP